MAMLEKPSRSLAKTLLGQTSPKKAIVANIVTGVGVDQSVRALDNTFGAPLQRLLSVPVPVLGNVGPIEIINYFIHTGGKPTKNVIAGLSAVFGSQVVKGTAALNFPIPGLGNVANPNVTPSGPGAPL